MNEATELDAMATQMPNDLDDLDNLFEFGDIDLNNIPDTDGFDGQPLQQQQQQQHPHQHSHPGTHPNTPFQDMSPAPPMPATSAHDFGGMDQFGISPNMAQTQQQQQFIDAHAQTTMPFTSEPMYQPSMQQMYHSQQQQFQMHSHQGYPHNNQVVPPTPNSFEMHGVPGRYLERHQQLDAQQQAILAQRYALRKEEIAFTPMVSPAGTPQYHMLPEFTTPGAYFSPLTSPMLHAQNQHHQQQLQMHLQQHQGYITNPSTAPSSNANSPVDPTMDVDMASGSMQGSTGPQPRKSGRRKIATAKGATTGGSKVNTSASQRAQKRKSSTQTQGQQASAAEDLSLHAIQTQPAPSTLQMPSQFDSSEAESISPEPLSESVMGPPPRPSTNQSPAMAGRQRQHANVVAAAATPKSLLTMRTAHQPVNGGSGDTTAGSEDLGGLDDLALPEAANTRPMRPTHAQINTNIPPSIDGEDGTPRMSARKTPKFGPLSTPSSARPGSAIQSPTVASPMSASTPSAILRDKKDAKGGRGSKKRGSMSTNGSKMVSPALVPKISPSIKPLLPEGTPLTSATQAMLLASKSNYQNLLEGNRLPGVNYPDSLSTGLTSKRTSHKVAEQGRRNRINEALKEMQALIPKSTPSINAKSPSSGANADDAASPADIVDECKSSVAATPADTNGNGASDTKMNENASEKLRLERERELQDAAAKSNSSKAATVELANEYIKRMQKEQREQNERIARLEREREILLGRLGESGGGGNPSPSEVGEV